MLEFDQRGGFLAYLFTMLALFVAAFIYERWRERRDAWKLSDAHACRCPGCNFGFLIQRGKTAAPCPRCGRNCTIYTRA